MIRRARQGLVPFIASLMILVGLTAGCRPPPGSSLGWAAQGLPALAEPDTERRHGASLDLDPRRHG